MQTRSPSNGRRGNAGLSGLARVDVGVESGGGAACHHHQAAAVVVVVVVVEGDVGDRDGRSGG